MIFIFCLPAVAFAKVGT